METVKLVDICTPRQWKTISTEMLVENGYPVYGANGIIGYYTEYNHEESVVTITCRGASCGSVNMTCPKAYITGNAMCLDSVDNNIDKDYLFYCMKHFDFARIISGSAQPQITRQGLEKVQIKVYEISKQKEIVAILKRVENIIIYKKKQLDELDALIKARFVEMFGDPIQNPEGWKQVPLLELGNCKNGMNFRYDDSGIAINCLGVGDFKDLSVISDTSDLPKVSLNEMPSDEYLLKDDDIVFVRSNGNKALVGRSLAVYPGKNPTTFSGFCIRFRKTSNEIMVPYLLRVLKADSVKEKMAGRGANIQNLNQQILGSLMIPVPSLDLQKGYAFFSAQIDKSKAEVQKALDETQLLFDSLMQQYFG